MTYQDVTYSWHKKFNLFFPDIWLGHCIPHYMVTPLKFFINIHLFRSFYSRFSYGFQKAFSFSVLAVSLHIPSFTLLSQSTLYLILQFTSGLMHIWMQRLWHLAGDMYMFKSIVGLPLRRGHRSKYLTLNLLETFTSWQKENKFSSVKFYQGISTIIVRTISMFRNNWPT